MILVCIISLTGCDDEHRYTVGGSNIVIENNAKNTPGGQSGNGGISIEILTGTVDKKETEDISAAGSDEDAAAAADDEALPETQSEEDDEESTATEETAVEETAATETPVVAGAVEQVGFDSSWEYAGFSKINSGTATMYRAPDNRKNVVIAVNAGHGTKGGQKVKTQCHPDGSPKVTGGSTSAGAIEATAVSGGMTFNNGSSEASVVLRVAKLLKDRLIANGYDVLMIRDGDDVQLDNVARTVMANNMAACHIALHFDGDGLAYDKGCFYISTPDGLKGMEPVASHYQEHEALGSSLIAGLKEAGCKINGSGKMAIDLTQTSYSTKPSVDIELGNQTSATDDASLTKLADGLLLGIQKMY
ncbi:MAG: N-acetylmuramoyl-L-alanine amidase [Lachnospiraceae bacterium]|nr:N-acetylmuramoyl-L-alanine amidase [Lachnospiraceae bacterium]